MHDHPEYLVSHLADIVSAIRALTSLNISSNNLGQLVLPYGWTEHRSYYQGEKYTHTDGRKQQEHPGKPEGAIAIVDAIPTMGALASLDLSQNSISESESSRIKAVCEVKSISLKV